jgi:ADP-heptose:LPS heptosyltransferase
MLYQARSILAIDIAPFGRSLELLPALRALRGSHPKTFIAVAAPTGPCELLVACGLVDEVIDLGVIKSPDRGAMGQLKRMLTLVRRSRRNNYDLVLDFSPRFETQLVLRVVLRAPILTPSKHPRVIERLMELSGVTRRAGTATSDYANVLKQAGVELKDPRFLVGTSVEEDARFERRLASGGSRGGELLVLLYASNAQGRTGWPVRSFAEIATRLANNLNARIIAADEPADSSFTDAVAAFLPQGAIRLSEPRAVELIAAIARGSIVVTDERAIARLASELGTPAIEVSDSRSGGQSASPSHRVAEGSSRARVSTDEVYDIACEMIQESRSDSLFRRP